MLSKLERTNLFFERLKTAPLCATAYEAMAQLASILDAIEDTFTAIPNDPTKWETDGRLYPPRDDIVRSRSRKHGTWIAQNGAIRITTGIGYAWRSRVRTDGP